MDIMQQIRDYAAEAGGELQQKKGTHRLKKVIAERKAFLTRKKVEYVASFRVDDEARTLSFSEMLRETGSGVSSGGGDDITPGFGFRKESYRTGAGPREGTIEEQSSLLGRKFEYSFDFRQIRGRFEQIAADNGYTFEYKISPRGV